MKIPANFLQSLCLFYKMGHSLRFFTETSNYSWILVNYSYLADGTKTSSLKASGEGLVYCRWMTPDPLSEKYYGLSPYNYCACNPVSVVDLDGRKIIIGTAFKRIQAFFGVDNYVSKVRAQLRKLKKIHPELRNVIATLKRTRNKYLIEPTSNRVDKGNGNGYLNHVIYYDPDNSVTNNGNVRSPIIGLAHELGHGFNDENGKSVSYDHEKAKNGDYIEGEKGNRNECFSISLENIVRNYLNVELRDYDYYHINLFLIEPCVFSVESSSK